MRAHRARILVISTLFACSSGPRDEVEASNGVGDVSGGNDSGSGPAEDSGPIKLDIGNPDTEGLAEGGEGGGPCGPTPPTNATLRGIVYAPNGDIPISDALVYVTDEPPDPIPQEVYCDECVELPCGTPHTFTQPDGSFELQTIAGAGQYFVIKKGQFMRVTAVDVGTGEASVEGEATFLPARNDPDAGLFIPRIALAYGAYDRLEDALGKFGLGEVVEGAVQLHTVPYDLYNNGATVPDASSVDGEFGDLVVDAAKLAQYHIVFVPCTNDQYVDLMAQQVPLQNIRDWVAAGGKWYVTDWSHEWMRDPFGQYQTFEAPGDLGFHYDSDGTVLDPDLLAWLQALPEQYKGGGYPDLLSLPSVTTLGHWSAVSATHEVLVDDGMGNQVDVGHHRWIQGPGPANDDQALTVSGEYGCGRILFTSYHTAENETYARLRPQELVLLYIILEVAGVCTSGYEPPPPVG